MKKANRKCLLLNIDYSPLCVISWKKAIIWQIKSSININFGIEIIDFYKGDYILGANGKQIPIPSIAKTKKFFQIYNEEVVFSRKNVFIRDNYTCQYCGEEKRISDLTYDHVIPKSHMKFSNKKHATCWTNIATACKQCNRKKGNRTPEQANMPLITNPFVPMKNKKYLPITMYLHNIDTEVPNEWKVYIT